MIKHFFKACYNFVSFSSKYSVNTPPANWISLMDFCRGSQYDTFTYFTPSSKNQ